jgi:helix-turn-helix protein
MSDASSNHRLQQRAADEPSRTSMNKQDLDLSPLLTAKEAATHLKVSQSWLAKARMRGDGPPYICVGRSIRYPVPWLNRWKNSRQRLSTASNNS